MRMMKKVIQPRSEVAVYKLITAEGQSGFLISSQRGDGADQNLILNKHHHHLYLAP